MGSTDAVTDGLDVYLVGGAVRDRLLGCGGGDRDFVVVGATREQMLARGFKPVGKDFPVFLHPRSGEEYALARLERKTGHGYHGFAFDASTTVTLEQDLQRRDLTINAMAQRRDGTLVDPFGGKADIEQRRLRHVSAAFVEDPVRILRVARFAARFAPLGFTVASETLGLMRRMVEDGEVDHLVPERVGSEVRRALAEVRPSAFLQTLRACGALARLLPEVDALYGVPQRAEFHPELDTGRHVELVLDMAARLAPGDDLVGWCALTHDLGKALTPADELPRHRGHEHRGVRPLLELSERLKMPGEHTQLAARVCELHLQAHRAFELRPVTVLRLLEALDSLRRPRRLEAFLLACEADARGRQGCSEKPYPQADFLRAAHAAVRAVQAERFLQQGLSGPEIGNALRDARIGAIRSLAGTA